MAIADKGNSQMCLYAGGSDYFFRTFKKAIAQRKKSWASNIRHLHTLLCEPTSHFIASSVTKCRYSTDFSASNYAIHKLFCNFTRYFFILGIKCLGKTYAKMNETPILNEHNKQEHPPMHTVEFDVSQIKLYIQCL